MPRIVPDIVRDQDITAVSGDDNVRDTTARMAERNVAAVVIIEKGKLAGIMTERDITVRVVANALDPTTTKVREVMTRNPDTLRRDDEPMQALRMMRERNYRHLPVVDEAGAVVAMVSVRDLYAFVLEQLEEGIRDRDHYIYGEAYGATS
jgi:CBS domain-containing protein